MHGCALTRFEYNYNEIIGSLQDNINANTNHIREIIAYIIHGFGRTNLLKYI